MKMNSKELKRCSKCGLPQTYPGIEFNKDGLCNYCVYFDLYKEREESVKGELQEEFKKLINKVKHQQHKYHCIVAYSGGKDSTFLLNFLKKEFGLKILAHVFDNSFISPMAMQNIRRVTNVLKVDCKISRPDKKVLQDVFMYALTEKIPYPKEILSMASQICAVCIGMVLGTTLNAAIKHKIPLLFIGFTPGQYPAISLENFFKVKSCLFLSDKVYRDDPLDVLKIIADPITERFGKKVKRFFFKSQYIPRSLAVPKILFPYHALLEYDEKEIIREISKLGWVKPKDTDTCSTNCLLNTVGNYTSIKQLGYHPYIGELSYLVRKGNISRDDALMSEYIQEDSSTMDFCLKKLGLNKDTLK